jgi:polyphosphate kinase 2 (PPK2 family)
LAELQDLLYADGRWGVLIVLQAIDAAGKDSSIKHPSPDDLRHNWYWRYSLRLPQRGEIGIFNRSHYEEVLIVRVHILISNQSLPDSLVGKNLWSDRFEDINSFEKHLNRNGIIVLKFFLNISAEEQRKRFIKRLEAPEKNWKFSFSDLEERRHWDSTNHAPWYCVQINYKWFGRLIITETINKAMQNLDLRYPPLTKEQKQSLEKG